MLKKQYITLFTTLFLLSTLHSQNLVSNGNFEDENICTEYIVNCAPEAWIATTLTANYYFDDVPWAHDGTHFVGLIAGSNKAKSVRSFICTRLLCSLRKGNQYELTFYIRSWHPVFDSIGIYFSTTHFLFEAKPLNVVPALLLNETGIDKQFQPGTWQKVSMIYTATGEENFMAIGNFKRLEHRYTSKPEDGFNYYVFIDEVKFRPLLSNEKLCPDADSMRAEIYSENERHTLLEKKRYVYRKAPPRVAKGSNTSVMRIDTLVLPDILFATASYQMSQETNAMLDSFCEKIQSRVIDSLIIEGHTDSVGSYLYNEKLSSNRAGAVAEYILRKTRFNSQLFTTRGLAFLRPVSTNKTTTGRQMNRRVEIFVYSRE